MSDGGGCRYLFGPVDDAYAHDNLQAARARGDCLVFAASGRPDVLVRSQDRWDDVLRRLPPGFRPDFIVLFLAYRSIPRCLWEAPLPRVGLAPDWHVLWHRYRFAVPRCDLVLSDPRGVELLRRAGMVEVAEANLFGCARPFLPEAAPRRRDIDVLYVGSLHPAQKGDRLAWLGRLVLALGERWQVVIRRDAGREEYLQLLQRARIVFNRSVRGECNLRAFEAAASGALLFQEAENGEVRRYLRDRRECVFYTAADLESLLERYLGAEDERRRLAAAARKRVVGYSFERLWDELVTGIERRLPALAGPGRSPAGSADDELAHRLWESCTSSTDADGRCDGEPELLADLAALLAERPEARIHNMLGVATARSAQRRSAFDGPPVRTAWAHFQQAVELAPRALVFRLNLCEALWRLGFRAAAARACREALAVAAARSELGAEEHDTPHFPPAFDTFRVEWERAAWSHAGSPAGEAGAKLRLVRWRLHSLLAALTDDLDHYLRALRLREDLWVSQAAAGRALIRAGRVAEGTAHLRHAVALNPFDGELGADLLHAVRAGGDANDEGRVARELALLRRAAPVTSHREIRFAQEVVA